MTLTPVALGLAGSGQGADPRATVAPPERYGRVKFTKIQATKNALRRAIQDEGTPRIQELWDRLEQWIDSPPMMQKDDVK